jgi:hypothetical protein
MRHFWFLSSLALALPVAAGAGECYLLGGYGSGTYRHNSAKLESKILSFEASGEYAGHSYAVQATGGYWVDQRSRPYHLGVGCGLGPTWSFELDYRRGFQMAINSHFGLRGQVDGRSFEADQVAFQQRVDMEGIGASFIGAYTLGAGFSLTGRLGVMHARARHSVTFPSLSSTRFVLREERGNLPIVGLGLLYRPSRSWSFAAEAVKYNGESEILSFVIRRYFDFL